MGDRGIRVPWWVIREWVGERGMGVPLIGG